MCGNKMKDNISNIQSIEDIHTYHMDTLRLIIHGILEKHQLRKRFLNYWNQWKPERPDKVQEYINSDTEFYKIQKLISEIVACIYTGYDIKCEFEIDNGFLYGVINFTEKESTRNILGHEKIILPDTSLPYIKFQV